MDNPDRPRQKWADRIRLFAGQPAECHELGADQSPPFPDLYGVTDLTKTAEESLAVSETVAAVNDFRQATAGLEPLALDERRVHVLAEKEFRRKFCPPGRPGISGKSMYGHVYLFRGQPLWQLMAILAHELVHTAGYLWVDIHARDAQVDANGLKWPRRIIRRAGMVLIDPSYGTWLPHFHGLNEMTTELAAMAIRKPLAERTALLPDPEDCRRLAEMIASPPQIVMVNRLIKEAAAATGDALAVMCLMFGDYFKGTDDFLAALEPCLPGATERLRRTGARPEELLSAAENLGLADEARIIRKYCPSTVDGPVKSKGRG